MKGKRRANLIGFILFFFTATFTVTLAFIAFSITSDKPKPIIAISVLCSIFFVAVVFFIADYIRRKIMIDKPLKEILKATEEIASGDFDTKLTTTHTLEQYNEFDYIKENLNIMASELAKNEVLKTDFISNVSHEIKTPVSVIKSYASLLENENDPEKRTEYRREISRASNRLSSLVENILKLNKLENQSLTLEKQEIKLDDMLGDCIVSFEGLIEKKNLLLECEIDEVTIVSSPIHLEMVWNNLISNAIKFTERGGKISISLKKIDGFACVTVTDTGCGMDQETGKRIFDKFYQGDTSHSSEGNGLGLALVKKVIDTLGGEISVKSELGVGTSFTIKLK